MEYEVDEAGHPSREDCDAISWPNYHFSHRSHLIAEFHVRLRFEIKWK